MKRPIMALAGLLMLARSGAAQDAPPPEPQPPPTPEPAPAPAPAPASAPAEAPAQPPKAPTAPTPAAETVSLPDAPFPFADRWRGDLYASGRIWFSADVALGMSLLEGDPEVSGTGRGNGFFVRGRLLMHLDLHWAVGGRFVFERAVVPTKDKNAWSDLEVSQLSAALTLRFAPLISQTAELAVLGHGGTSQDSFQSTERLTGATTTWSGPALIGGGGLELSLFPASAYRQLAVSFFAEVEIHSGGKTSEGPAYREGGLPHTARAVLRSGAGLGYHF